MITWRSKQPQNSFSSQSFGCSLCLIFRGLGWREKKGKPELKGHTSKKVLVFQNCLNGCQITQLGLAWAFITSTASLQIRTTHLILAARGTFLQPCSRGVCSQVSSLISRSREEQNRDQSRSVPVLQTVNTSLHLNSLLVAVWLRSRTLLLIPPYV